MENRPFDDQTATTPMSREAIHGAQQQQYPPGYRYPPPGPEMYGYGSMPWGGGRAFGRRGYGPRVPIETKPFYLTSEFLGTLLAVIAVAITAASVEDLDSRLGMALIAGLVAAYTISRGIAKSGTRSRAYDPREELLAPRREPAHERDSSGV
jgi:hypothetical protein